MPMSQFYSTQVSHLGLPLVLSQWILTDLLWGIRVAWPLDTYFDSILLGVVLLTTGIPHGANDLPLLRQRYPTWSWVGAFGYYLVLVLAAISLMVCFPLLGFVVFLDLSAYHFGQGDLQRYLPFPRSCTAGWRYLSWGSLLLTALLGLHASGLEPYLPPTKGMAGLILFSTQLLHSPWVYLALAAGLFAITVWGGYLQMSDALGRLMITGFLFTLFAQTSLLFSFSVYFGTWHCAEVIELFSQRLYGSPPTAHIGQFYRQAPPLTVLVSEPIYRHRAY